MNLGFCQNADLRCERCQKSIELHQDSGSELQLPFPGEIFYIFNFFKKINCSVSNLDDKNGACEKFKSDLLNSLEYVNSFFKQNSNGILDFEIDDFVLLITNIFISIDIDVEDILIAQFNITIIGYILNFMCYLISSKSNIFQQYYDISFIYKLRKIIIKLSDIQNNNELLNSSQFLFAKLMEDKDFRIKKDFAFWKDIANLIKNDDVISSIYYELSKDAERIGLSSASDFLYSIMSIFPEKENLCSKIQYVKINTQSIVNCIEIIDNELILTQVQNDINHFMPKIVNLIEIRKPISQLRDENMSIEIQNLQIVCFCELMQCFIKKGIIADFQFFTQGNDILSNIMNLFESIISLKDKNFNLFFRTNYSVEVLEQILMLFTIFTAHFKKSLDKKFLHLLVAFALDSPFKIRKAAALLICQMIEIEIISVREDNLFKDSNFYNLLLNLIILPAYEIIEPLLDCLLTLFYESYDFISFILSPEKFDELENLKSSLDDIIENVNSEHVCDLAGDVLCIIKKNSPESNEERSIGSNFENENVFNDY